VGQRKKEGLKRKWKGVYGKGRKRRDGKGRKMKGKEEKKEGKIRSWPP
jgi:hypothetical protein